MGNASTRDEDLQDQLADSSDDISSDVTIFRHDQRGTGHRRNSGSPGWEDLETLPEAPVRAWSVVRTITFDASLCSSQLFRSNPGEVFRTVDTLDGIGNVDVYSSSPD